MLLLLLLPPLVQVISTNYYYYDILSTLLQISFTQGAVTPVFTIRTPLRSARNYYLG